jgi:predicted DNA-binding transcriptional regulator AlpA
MTEASSPLSVPFELLSTSELLARLSITRPTLFAWIENSDFPRPMRLSTRRLMWEAREVEQWLKTRPRS